MQAQSKPNLGTQRPQITKKKNEVEELQDDLLNNNINIKKEAIRKIIDAMTRGKDVSMLFTHVIRNMMTDNMELKKLIYLYIINYAKSKPDLAILAVNSFRSDATNQQNPLLRSLAVRTMGCIRIKSVVEYLLDPLKKAIKDEDSYVRKTAAICIAKLFETHPDIMEEQGFLVQLQNLLNDGNAMVVSNAVCALMSIQEIKGENLLQLDRYKVQKLRTAMNECNEWGIIYILDAISVYQPTDSKETQDILERIVPLLQHCNPGVILSAVKVIMKYLDFITDPELIINYCKKLTSPLISLLNQESEVIYVALKNINLILQKRPMIIEKEIKYFFCNFNDPIYIKTMKIEILIRLANLDNIHQILSQLKEHTTEVDIEIAKKSIRSIGRCAIKLEKAAPKCVQVLRECLQSKNEYVMQETIIVIRDIFRKYPKDYEGILKEICENLTTLDNPEAKAAMIWIIGEYVTTIENSDELLTNFAESFLEEPAIVQHQILTSCIKLFLMRHQEGYQLIQKLLQQATNNCENPDLRDRGYIYWRLLGQDPQLAKEIVYSERPEISDSTYILETELLDKLIENIGTLSSVYYKPPQQFVKHLRDIINQKELEENDEDAADELLNPTEKDVDNEYYGGDAQITNNQAQNVQNTNNLGDLLDDDLPVNNYQQQPPQYMQQNMLQNNNNNNNVNLIDDDDDLLGGNLPQQQPTQQQQQYQQPMQQQVNNLIDDDDLLGPGPSSQQQQQPIQQQYQASASRNIKIPLSECINENKFSQQGKVNGLNIAAAFQRENDRIYLELQVINKFGQNTFTNFAIKFGPNKFKLLNSIIDLPQLNNVNIFKKNIYMYIYIQLHSGQTLNTNIDVNCTGQIDQNPLTNPFTINCLINTNFDVYALTIPCSLTVLMIPNGKVPFQVYQQQVQKMVRKADKIQIAIERNSLIQKLEDNNIYMINSQVNPQGVVIEVSLANFGFFPYGHKLSGRLQLAVNLQNWDENQTEEDYKKYKDLDNTACTQIRQFNQKYFNEHGYPILVADRGDCTFVTKGLLAQKSHAKMLIIIDNSLTESLDDIIMSDDLSGNQLDIPVVLITNKSGKILKDLFNIGQEIQVSINFNKPQEEDTAEIQYWMLPTDKKSYDFLLTQQQFIKDLLIQKKIVFEPHFVFLYCDDNCKKSPDYVDYCVSDGKYCHPDPDDKGLLRGKDSVLQALQELCVSKVEPILYFDYALEFYLCIENKSNNKDCNDKALQKIEKDNADDVDKVKFLVEKCLDESWATGKYADKQKDDNTLLEKELNLYKVQGLRFFPHLFVNGQSFRGDLYSRKAAQEFMCEGIHGAENIELCKEYMNAEDDENDNKDLQRVDYVG
ncbi:hypothetical protein IMG5_134800 [Ichthyophthirius multifiliis]|uniref:Uncharacterized protein n=1 Tax=Ichthyophthirius multifiliis TaxID=5932 RepID=G0QWS6_ICHMU|nr:hypothetical protein IMG5_134800 [Ichthyophthirius multifiliis]EGR30331.1 hypothetical protein IMG5_134800 [Ichthyophthirius multifiliis]|eukprot:XP_004031918.1 hypothetical protein IMG5_134800 [Ichthyophthirius multifiliis]